VTTGLEIYVHGQPSEVDAGKVISGLRHVLELLKNIEDANARGRPGRSTWRFTALNLSSFDAEIAVLEPRPGLSTDDVDSVLQLAVDGLALTESSLKIPQQWNLAAVESARKLADTFGSVTDRGARLAITRDSTTVAEANVTAQAARNITKVTGERRRSFGSVIGKLDAITLHDRREAGLWTDLGQHRVSIRFSPELLDMVHASLGKRVEASGVVWRDYRGVPVSVELRRIAELSTRAESPSLTELAGVWVRGTP
jgi:hypothetical protein